MKGERHGSDEESEAPLASRRETPVVERCVVADDSASTEEKATKRPAGIGLAILALGIALMSVGGSCATNHPERNLRVSEAITSSRRMPDGRQWTTANLNLDIAESYCYAGAELNCRRYGRLYTWHSAQRGCRSLGDGWRLPENDDWRQMAKHFGGIRDESADTGKAAYEALSIGGSSGFDALLGGGRAPDGQYARVDAHGFYWTASETAPATAWFYNFGKGQLSLGRHDDGEKQRAFSVRCVRD